MKENFKKRLSTGPYLSDSHTHHTLHDSVDPSRIHFSELTLSRP